MTNALENDLEKAAWSVIAANGKKLFEGLEADARKFIADHFPRFHVEPYAQDSTPDAVLVSPTGNVKTGDGVETHNGGVFTPVNPSAEAPATVETPDEGNDNGDA